MPSTRSSTQCELVAFTLVAHVQRQPPLVLSDSLCALQLLRSWGTRSTNKVLCCPERAEVRQFLRQWAGQRAPHTLEKVKAHDSAGVHSGSIKTFVNDKVDGLAKEVARGVTLTYKSYMCFADVVLFRDSSGAMISDVGKADMLQWWDQQGCICGGVYALGCCFAIAFCQPCFIVPIATVISGLSPCFHWMIRNQWGMGCGQAETDDNLC